MEELPTSGSGLDLEMCRPAFTPLLFDLDVGSTDEEVMLFLGGRKAGDPIPANVITEVNPFSFEPWDSPEGMWYLYNPINFHSCTEGRNIEVRRIGYWKPVDGNLSDTAGTKTTLEFYVGPEPFGIRTGWMMHEYHRDQKACHGSNFSQDYKSMCRVFFQNDQSSNFYDFKLANEEQHSPFGLCDDADDAADILMRFLEDDGSSSSIEAPHISQPCTGSKQVAPLDERPPLSINTSFQDLNCSSSSDPHAYLELNDLYDPDSAPSSSDNSTIISIHSEDYFNSEELLRYLMSTNNQNTQEKPKDHKFSLSTSTKPFNVAINPSGLIACHNSLKTHID